MTEPEWLAADSPVRLFRHVRSRLSARKLKLLACGCCRLLDPLLSDAQRDTLAVVERHADGFTTNDDYQRAVDDFGRGVMDTLFQPPADPDDPTPEQIVQPMESLPAVVAQALQAVVTLPNDFGLMRAMQWVSTAARRRANGVNPLASTRNAKQQMCEVYREIVGNPFRERVTAGPEWVLAGGRVTGWMLKVSETARAIARGVEADQAFDRLPILADALEDDGCSDAELLGHLRGSSHHLRGCWAVDLVLGKS